QSVAGLRGRGADAGYGRAIRSHAWRSAFRVVGSDRSRAEPVILVFDHSFPVRVGDAAVCTGTVGDRSRPRLFLAFLHDRESKRRADPRCPGGESPARAHPCMLAPLASPPPPRPPHTNPLHCGAPYVSFSSALAASTSLARVVAPFPTGARRCG